MRIPNGPVLNRGREHQLYVIEAGHAVKRDVETGLKGDDYVEVIEGLSEGDRVVLSDISSIEDIEGLNLRR